MNMIMIEELMNQFRNGKKEFYDIEIEDGKLIDQNLENITFEKCFFSIDFSKSNLRSARFISCNMKASMFNDSDLSGANLN